MKQNPWRWTRCAVVVLPLLAQCSGEGEPSEEPNAPVTPSVTDVVPEAAGGQGMMDGVVPPASTAGGESTTGETNGGEGTGAPATSGGSSAQPPGGGTMPASGMTTPADGGGGTPPASTMSGDDSSAVDCVIEATAEISEAIATVGIVQWSTDLASVDEAYIEFGKDANYGMRADVDLAEPNYRTLLLGMEGSSSYHYRVVARAGSQLCMGPDQTLDTGLVPNTLLNLQVETTGEVAPGFIITTSYQSTGGGGFGSFVGGGGGGAPAPAYILNEAGNPVWFYSAVSEPTRARMSYDGKYMWVCKANVPNTTAQVVRVSMDGLQVDDFSADFANLNHDFTVTPDESVIFIAYGSDGCDDVKERRADGTVRTIVNSRDAHGESGACHLNAIHYFAEDDTVVFSDLQHDNYTKVHRETGETVWVLGGPNNSSFTGDGASWDAQHGFHLIAKDRMLIFNNNPGQTPAEIFEVSLDLDAMTATKVWSYSSDADTDVMGDAQRLSNGNTLVTYSIQGRIQEVTPEGEVVQVITGGLGAAVGYAQKRERLYGPPPR